MPAGYLYSDPGAIPKFSAIASPKLEQKKGKTFIYKHSLRGHLCVRSRYPWAKPQEKEAIGRKNWESVISEK